MGKAWNSYLDTLNSELEAIEQRTFNGSALSSVALARQRMIEIMRSTESGRYERGLAIRDYRNEYRKNGHEQVWRDDNGAGAKIARADGNSNSKSADIWIAEAEFAEPLGDLFREALLSYNYEPTKGKNSDIVIALIDLVQENTPVDLEEARKLVGKVLEERSSRSRVRRHLDASEQRERLVMRVAAFIMEQPARNWADALKEIREQVAKVLQSELDERRAADERSQRAAASRANANGLNHPVVKPAVGTSWPKPTSKVSPPTLARKKPSRPQAGRKYSHPWGNACLDVLELLTPIPGGTEKVRFNRERLYEVGMKLKPTRYLVAGKLDMFDPGLPDELFDEHLEVFQKAIWHTFVVLTPYAHSIQRHWQRWNIKPRHGFPTNFWPGVRVDSVNDLGRVSILRQTGMRTSWVSLVDYHSDPLHPLSKTTFRDDIRGAELVVFGWDFAKPQRPLSPDDAYVLAEAATEPGSGFFFTHPDSRRAFLTGIPPISGLPEATNPPVNDEAQRESVEGARSRQDLPREWFEHPFSGRKGVFKGFTGEQVQLFDYKPHSKTHASLEAS